MGKLHSQHLPVWLQSPNYLHYSCWLFTDKGRAELDYTTASNSTAYRDRRSLWKITQLIAEQMLNGEIFLGMPATDSEESPIR